MATFDAFALAAAIGARTERIALHGRPARGRRARSDGDGDGRRKRRGGLPGGRCISRSAPRARWWSSAGTAGRGSGPRRTSARRPRRCGRCSPARSAELRGRAGAHARLPAPPAAARDVADGRRVRRARRSGSPRDCADRMVINLCTPDARRPASRAARRATPREAGVEAPPLAAWVAGLRRPGRGGDRPAQPRGGRATWRRRATAEMFARGRVRRARRAAPADAPAARAAVARVPPELCRAIGLVGTEAEVRARRRASTAPPASTSSRSSPATAGDPGGRRTLEALRPSLSP